MHTKQDQHTYNTVDCILFWAKSGLEPKVRDANLIFEDFSGCKLSSNYLPRVGLEHTILALGL